MASTASYTYETVYILKPNVSESDASVIHQKIDNVISKFQGKLVVRDDWGLKDLAYEIDDVTNGRYVVIHYTGKGGVVEEIERHFKILDDVIRFITVRVADDYDYQKSKKQLAASEEENKRQRELRKAPRDFGGGGRDFGGGGRDFGGGGRDFGGGGRDFGGGAPGGGAGGGGRDFGGRN